MGQESVAIWKKRLAEAKEVHGDVVKETHKYARAYNGSFPASLPGLGAYDDNVSQNFVYKILNVAQANILFRRPAIMVPPSSPDEQESAPVQEAILNRIIEQTGIETESKLQFKDAFLRGCGWIKFGYHSESSPSEDNIEVDGIEAVDAENHQLLAGNVPEPDIEEDHGLHIAGHEVLLNDATTAQAILELHGLQGLLNVVAHIEAHRNLLEKKSKKGKLNWRVAPNQVWARYVDFRDVIVDPNATRWEDVRWIAFRSVQVLKGLKRSEV